jgi:tetratricopeptide (TPR) repeat protein
MHQAKKALSAGHVDAALSQLESAETLQPHRAELLFLLGRANRRADRLEAATQYLEAAESAGYPAEPIREQRYLLSAQVGQFELAESFMQDAIRRGVDDTLAEEIYEARAKGYLKTFRLGDAIFCLKYWIEWKSEAVFPRMLLADVWVRADNWKEAASEYEHVLRLEPDHLDALCGLANCRFALQEIEKAKGYYNRALNVDPDHVRASIGVAKCDVRLADTLAASGRFQSLLEREDLTTNERLEVLLELAQIHIRDQRDPEGALKLLLEAESLDPYHHQLNLTLASVYRRLGQPDEARQHEETAKASSKRLEELTEITRTLIERPKDAELRFRAGQIFMEQGMKRAGAEWLSTALIFDPAHRGAHLALARYYEETGEHEIAAQHRERAGP